MGLVPVAWTASRFSAMRPTMSKFRYAARSVAELPHWMTEEARDRVERFRRKHYPPPAWSDKKWQETCASLARLAAEVPEIETPQAGSPVTDY